MKKQGDRFEKFVSSRLHASSIPVLISDKLLNRRGMGQVDLAFIARNKMYVAECKQGMGRLSSIQLKRLEKTSGFVSLLFKMSVNLIGVKQVAKLNDAEYPFKVCNIRELM